MNREQFQTILNSHKLYLETGEGVRADLRNANLRGVNLKGADLRSADLRSADLRGVNLKGADLRSADLRSADLLSANLRCADLHGADLHGADLHGADLWNVIGNQLDVFTFQTRKYVIVIHKERIQIGCQNHSYEEWFGFSDDEIIDMDYGALEWWESHKEFVQACYKIANS